ncbi:histidine kinase [Nonomuraea antimicrobica]
MSPTHPVSEDNEPAQGQLRKLNLTMFLPLLVVAGAVVVATDARSWWDALVLGAGVVAALVSFVRWAAGDVLRVALPCLIVTAAVWPYSVLVAGGSAVFFAVASAGAFVIPQLSRRRVMWAVALTVYVAAVGASRLLVAHEDVSGVLFRYVLIPTGITAAIIGLRFPNKRFYDVVTELEAAREREAELAVIRERVRFASDLHDIQGHTLHVVKLKTALAQKLVDSDTERAKQELRRSMPWSATPSRRPRRSPTHSGGSTSPPSWRTPGTSSRPRASTCASTAKRTSTRARANCSARCCARPRPTSCATPKRRGCRSPCRSRASPSSTTAPSRHRCPSSGAWPRSDNASPPTAAN